MRIPISSAVAATLLLGLSSPAQDSGVLRAFDQSESAETFSFSIDQAARVVTVHLLEAAEWDWLEFEVTGAAGNAIGIVVPNAPEQLVPQVTEGNFEWRTPAALTRGEGALRFAVQPGGDRFVIGFPRPRPIAEAPYYTYNQFVQYFDSVLADPGIAEITQLGTSIQGRPLYRMIIDPPSTQTKKTVLMAVRQHGDEFGSSYLLEGALDLLLGRNGQVAEPELLERVRWIIYPMMNPDGAVARQRGNANGFDLNRQWLRAGCSGSQQKEISILQCDLESMHATYGIDIGGDHHGWGNASNHGGFRYAQGQSVSFVSGPEYQEARKDTEVIELHDPSQFNWIENGGTLGMLRAEMFLRFGFLLHTPEYSNISSPAHFYEKGQAWIRAMYDTLYAPRFTDAAGIDVRFARLGKKLWITADDLDENTNPNTRQTIEVTVQDPATGDSEILVLTETGDDTGVFRNTSPLSISRAPATSGNGVLEAAAGSILKAIYVDDDYPRNTSEALVPVIDVRKVVEGVKG